MTALGTHDAIAAQLKDARIHSGNIKNCLGTVRNYLDNYPDDNNILAGWIGVHNDYLDKAIADCERMDAEYEFKDYKITALVSTYKSEEFIGECLDDLLSQTIADQIEVVVIDSASPDHESLVVEKYQKKHTNLRYLRTPSRISIYEAWNIAIRMSSADFLIPASTNDRLSPDACSLLVDALEKHPEVMLAYGDSYLTDMPHQHFGAHTPSTHFGGAWRWPHYSFQDLLNSCRVGPHPMWRKKVHSRIGYFDMRYTAIGDQDMWLRIGRLWPIIHIAECTGLAWLSKASLSGNDTAFRKEILDIRLRHQNLYLSSIHGAKFATPFAAQNIRTMLEAGIDYGFPPDCAFDLEMFAETVTRLVERGRNADAKAYYRYYRCLFPSTAEIEHFDRLICRME